MEMILYLEVNLICIAILFSVFIRDAQQRKNDTYHILFTRVLFANIMFFVADILWGIMSFLRSPHITANWLINIIYFSVSGVAAYFWLDFVEKMIDPGLKRKKSGAVLRMLPMILLIIFSVSSVQNHWLFFIDSAGHYQRGALYIIQPILAYILPAYSVFIAIRAVLKTNNLEKKRQYRSLAMFYVLPAIGGILQVILIGTPMLNIGIAISGLWLYFTFQDNITMLDPLTAMNNRRFFDRGLEALIHGFEADSGKSIWLILSDVDYFKNINDGYGHAEGDKALITVADTLKEVCYTFNCTAARVGGDEFAIYCESNDKSLPEKLCAGITQTLSNKSEQYPFKLRLSMGVSQYVEGMTPQQLYVSADNRLYEIKKSR